MGDFVMTEMVVSARSGHCGVARIGDTAENVADEKGIIRLVPDRCAVECLHCASAVIDTDEYPEAGTTLEKLGKMRVAFRKHGSVAAGIASGLNGGATALGHPNGATGGYH